MASEAVSFQGSQDLSDEYGLETTFRFSKYIQIYEETNEILRTVVADETL